VVGKNEYASHFAYSSVEPLTISLWWQALCGRVLHCPEEALLPVSASLLGVRARVSVSPVHRKT